MCLRTAARSIGLAILCSDLSPSWLNVQLKFLYGEGHKRFFNYLFFLVLFILLMGLNERRFKMAVKRYIFSRMSTIEDWYEVMAENAEEAFDSVGPDCWFEQKMVEEWDYELEDVEDLDEDEDEEEYEDF